MTTNHDDHGDDVLMPGNDPLDGLLREWHAENAASAAVQRDSLMRALAKDKGREQSQRHSAQITLTPTLSLKGEGVKASRFARFTPAIAASLAFAATLGLLFSTVGPHVAQARGDVIMAPNGGRLDAVNARGELIGPCPLRHTDVHVEVSGSFARVTLQQRYGNPYADKIEAVYTFPLSHRAAVDRMTMTIGDRVVVGEVKEREAARATYEAAKSAGHAAALLEQERPNIFTQSVANIEPGVEIVVEISYVELLEARDGLFGFTFPMVVAPRYIPGGDDAGKPLPPDMQHRDGLNLLAPATLTLTVNGDTSKNGVLTADVVHALISDAIPIETPAAEYWPSHYPATGQPVVWHYFDVAYLDGQREPGVLYTDGLGQINGRWFYVNTSGRAWPPTAAAMPPGSGFASDTAKVPDASRITPQPVKPPTRAGHDISITVNIDTGGPGITDLKSELHAVQQNWGGMRTDGTPSQVAVSLNDVATIPNQDFVLHWRQTADTITEQVFTHADARGGFITLILNPPARVENTDAVPRELVFVLDTSGSMQGFPIQKAKEVMSKAIAALRPQDTFNVITFAGDTSILWDAPQPASPDKLAEAQKFIESREGHGGTEMMTAINAALTVKPEQRQIAEGQPTPVRIVCFLTDAEVGNDMAIIDAVKNNAATTRVFSFGIGNSVNRYLLDGMAKAGRGAVEYVLLSEGADEKVASFTQRIQSPVLMNVKMDFAGDIEIVDRVPEELPDLYDVSPVIVHARYTKGGKGSVTLRGDAGSGPYEKTIELDLPEVQAEHDVIATLWAREKVEQIMNRDLAAAQNGTFPDELKKQVIDLGESFQIMTQYTSFVAVENLRVTVGGQPRLVPVPIELPEGQSWEGTMGEAVNKWADEIAPQDFVGRTVDMWSLVRANNATPKQFNCPSSTNTPDPAQDTSAYYDFLTEVHLSYAYQYSEGVPAVGDGIAPLDAKAIPPEILSQVARQVADQSQPEVTRTFAAELAANDEILARHREQLTATSIDAHGVSDESLRTIQQKLAGSPIDVTTAGSDSLVINASESDLGRIEEVLRELESDTGTSVAARPITGPNWPRPSVLAKRDASTSLDTKVDPQVFGMIAGQTGQPPTPQTDGPESTYWFDVRSANAPAVAGQPVTTTGQPAELGEVNADITLHRYGVADSLAASGSTGSFTRSPPQIAAAEGRQAGAVARVPVVGFIAPAPGGSVARLKYASPAEVEETLRRSLDMNLGRSVTSTTPAPNVPPVLNSPAEPQGSTENGQSLYWMHSSLHDVNNATALEVATIADSGGTGGATQPYDANGDGMPDMQVNSGGEAISTYDGRHAGNSKSPELGDIPGLGIAFQKTPPPALESPAKRPSSIPGSLGGSETNAINDLPERLNESDSVVSVKGISALLLEVVDDPDPVEVGQDITYTLTVTNQGTVPYSKIALSVALPEQVRPIRCDGSPAQRDGQTIRYLPLGKLEPKTRMTRTLTVRPVMTGDTRITTYMGSAEMKGEPVMETERSNFYAIEGGEPRLAPETIADIDRQWPDGAWRGGDLSLSPIMIDQFLVRAAGLAQAGRPGASKAVVDTILMALPTPTLEENGNPGGKLNDRSQGDFAVASAMRDTLTNGVITPRACVERVRELAAGPAKRLAASAERARLMAKRLDERLLRLALSDVTIRTHHASGGPATTELAGKRPVATSEATTELDVTNAGVLVSVLVDAFGDGTVAALVKAGLKIESTSKPTRVVIGRIPANHLGDLAMCKHVRKVEAVKAR